VGQIGNDFRRAGNAGPTLLLLQRRDRQRAAALRWNELGAGQRRRQHRTRRAARGVKPAPVQLGNEFFTAEKAWMIRLDRGRRGRCLRSACAAMRAPALMYPGAALRRTFQSGLYDVPGNLRNRYMGACLQ